MPQKNSTNQLFNLEELGKLLTACAPKFVGAIVTLVLGFWIIGKLTGILHKTMKKRDFDPIIRPFLASIVNIGLKVLLLLSVASMFGIETTSFIVIFSALAFAVGLALQGSLGHFTSGVLLLVFKPYKVGDLVTIGGGFTGTVKGIQVFNTILVTLGNKHIIVPNGVVTSNVMINISGQGIIGVEFTFSISYKNDIDKARDFILRAGKEGISIPARTLPNSRPLRMSVAVVVVVGRPPEVKVHVGVDHRGPSMGIVGHHPASRVETHFKVFAFDQLGDQALFDLKRSILGSGTFLRPVWRKLKFFPRNHIQLGWKIRLLKGDRLYAQEIFPAFFQERKGNLHLPGLLR